ncbi:MAG: hemolysin III family protein [Proteobacteria bacterium]|nr:hemolysin III family protein [Pseudomonadota bacterium]
MDNPVRAGLDVSAALLFSAAALYLWRHCGWEGPQRVALVTLAVGQVGLFGVSALYHGLCWSPAWKRRMQRLDHAMIYFKIAGCVTPLALAVIDHTAWPWVLAVWTIAAVGIGQKLWFPTVPPRASIPVQVLQGGLALPLLVALAQRFPGPTAWLALAAGGLYAVGAVVFLTERPRLWPQVFSFHELFHVFLVVAGGCYTQLLLQLAGR